LPTNETAGYFVIGCIFGFSLDNLSKSTGQNSYSEAVGHGDVMPTLSCLTQHTSKQRERYFHYGSTSVSATLALKVALQRLGGVRPTRPWVE